MLMITGHILTDPAEVHALADRLRAGVPATLEEDGCLFYAFALDDAAKGSILVVERWRDQAALDAHLATPAATALFAEWGDKLTIEVKTHDVANERGFGA